MDNGEYGKGCLANDNDNGISFAQIADIIEAHESELFVEED